MVAEAMNEAFQEFGWLVNPCSPKSDRGEHGIIDEKQEVKMFEKCCRFGLQCSENLFDRRIIQEGGLAGHIKILPPHS